MQLTDRVIVQSPSFGRLLQLAGDHRPFHAYLLTGAPVPTLARVARAFVAWLDCAGRGNAPCGTCSSCRLMTAGTHPAVHVVRPEGNELSIDVVRGMIDGSSYLPPAGQFRVFIIQEADTMGDEAANAFLKTLEEPPSRTVFILLSDRPDAIIRTITSRCLVVPVQLPPAEAIAQDVPVPSGLSTARFYLSLLLTRSSLDLVDRVVAGEGERVGKTDEGEPEQRPSVAVLMAEYLERRGAEDLVSSSAPFHAEARHPLALFDWLLETLHELSRGPDVAVARALTLHGAHRALETAVTSHVRAAERSQAETLGREAGARAAVDTLVSRTKRRSVTQHTLLLLDALQVAVRLALVRDLGDGTLPFDLHQELPALDALSGRASLLAPALRDVVARCRERLFSNVSERLMLTDLFLELSDLVIITGAAASPPRSRSAPPDRTSAPEGGARLDA